MLVLAVLPLPLLSLVMKYITRAIIASPAIPPTTPPTMAPVGVPEGAGTELLEVTIGAVVVGEPLLPLAELWPPEPLVLEGLEGDNAVDCNP